MTSPTPAGWQTITQVAHDFGKTRQTIHNWVTSGFILTLGYTIRRDVSGFWLLQPPTQQ